MNKIIDSIILKYTGAEEILSRQTIQELWSGYGSIVRLHLKGSSLASVVVKHIQIPSDERHSRGWNSDISHQRKIKSYEVETLWYENWSSLCNDSSPVPKLLGIERIHSEVLLILEELESEWRSLYPLAWTDFYRFLKGWSPGYCNNNGYSERIFREVIQELKDSGDFV